MSDATLNSQPQSTDGWIGVETSGWTGITGSEMPILFGYPRIGYLFDTFKSEFLQVIVRKQDTSFVINGLCPLTLRHIPSVIVPTYRK